MSQDSSITSSASTPAIESSPIEKTSTVSSTSNSTNSNSTNNLTTSPQKNKLGNSNKAQNNMNKKAFEEQKKHVLPWDNTEHEVPIKSFTGYEVNFNGWIRKDIREERRGKNGQVSIFNNIEQDEAGKNESSMKQILQEANASKQTNTD
ncbi:hypothetical protein TBLA_0A09850 [Henningerozyma blattae CBS 6284]|uniref:Uncharacterized protein n=1 Tax=Henningerozyma blattae (strain ATCC 34711 / CBS 6284 / DSM 70876 / NBRC 10599 / NRRL Y-10934 / UCD 77-7) TaxID=1071380 RepID=I2GXB6_HENB6|nr:hypothetical protein TBLA_0A09850 [Tetrapisispora blattae CBS 6284]CCH58768.1 hypothetical protein TBLA_0A09850 [Tetrapisispora blattae CBS 6284]